MPKFVFFSILLSMQTSVAEGMEVLHYSCTEVRDVVQCRVSTRGVVRKGDVLFMSYLVDADRTYYESRLLGETGFFLGQRFYAAFLPRAYSLDDIEGVEDPTFTIHVTSIFGDTSGLPSGKGEVRILNASEARGRVFAAIMLRLLAFGLLGFIAAYAVLIISRRHYEGWAWRYSSEICFQISAILFSLSMFKVLRPFVPTLMSQQAYYRAHGIFEVLAIFFLSRLIVESRFSDPSSIAEREVEKESSFLRVFNILGAVGAGSIVLGFSFVDFKSYHAVAVAIQAFPLFISALSLPFKASFRYGFNRSSTDVKIFLSLLVLTAVVMVRDSIVYVTDHSPDVVYIVHYFFSATVFSLAFRAYRVQRLDDGANNLRRQAREKLEYFGSGYERLSELCKFVQKRWRAARVAILEVSEKEVVMLASSGPKAKKTGDYSRPVGPLLATAISRRHFVYARTAGELYEFKEDYSFRNACMVFPIQNSGSTVAAMTIMARDGQEFSVNEARTLERLADSLSLEVLSAMNELETERQNEHLKGFLSVSSGIVLEYLDKRGNLPKHVIRTTRMIISADMMKSTAMDEKAMKSSHVAETKSLFKRELFSTWIALRQEFGFISKDIRGDDFWALSSNKSERALVNHTDEESAILLALLLEKHCRLLATAPPYFALGVPGAHVALTCGSLRVERYGIAGALAVDTDSEHMSRLSRIRSAAQPGGILVERSSVALEKALRNSTCFHAKPFVPKKGAFGPDLLSYPAVSFVTLRQSSTELESIEQRALRLLDEEVYSNEESA